MEARHTYPASNNQHHAKGVCGKPHACIDLCTTEGVSPALQVAPKAFAIAPAHFDQHYIPRICVRYRGVIRCYAYPIGVQWLLRREIHRESKILIFPYACLNFC